MPDCTCHYPYDSKGVHFDCGNRAHYIPLPKGRFLLSCNGKVIGVLPAVKFYKHFKPDKKVQK